MTISCRRHLKAIRHAASRGFTLIELMVVLVIIGVLAALIVPNVLDRADDAALSGDVDELAGREHGVPDAADAPRDRQDGVPALARRGVPGETPCEADVGLRRARGLERGAGSQQGLGRHARPVRALAADQLVRVGESEEEALENLETMESEFLEEINELYQEAWA